MNSFFSQNPLPYDLQLVASWPYAVRQVCFDSALKQIFIRFVSLSIVSSRPGSTKIFGPMGIK